MKKKLLFIMDTFPLGGISKSLLALLNELGDKYEIDFLLMKREGIFIPMLPSTVCLLDEPIGEEFRNPHPKNVFKYFKSLTFHCWLKWCGYSLMCSFGRLIGGIHRQVQIMDVYIGKHAKKIDKHYDAGIAYQGGRCIYYLAEKVSADVRIGYVHSDYLQSEVDYMLKPTDEIYFPQMDYIVTISPECLSSLHKVFPELRDKLLVIENICSPKMIWSMANQGESFSKDFKGIRLATMGRFDIYSKGIDLAIKTCKILVENKVDFQWYFLGDGHDRPRIEKMICECNVKDNFILLGAKTNPYPYIKDSDVYIQPSRYEGKSVALDEVKALQKPIVVTNFSTVNDQFVDGETALIAEMSPEDIADKIIRVINDEGLRRHLIDNLTKEKIGNVEEARRFEGLI